MNDEKVRSLQETVVPYLKEHIIVAFVRKPENYNKQQPG
jgi:hypothetical protein